MWEDIGVCGKTWECVGGHRILWQDVELCGGIGDCGRTEESVGGHRRVWKDRGVCGSA